MAKYTASPDVKRQWRRMEKQEIDLLAKIYESEDSYFTMLQDKIPDKLNDTLSAAFAKAFQLIFKKGSGVIEKTYSKDRYQEAYQRILEAAGDPKEGAAIRELSEKARSTRNVNVLISGLEGLGLGALGIGLPDIPVFVGMLFRSIYEVALSYGYDYKDEQEQIFILQLIYTCMQHGEDLKHEDTKVNTWIHTGSPFRTPLDKQIRKTADAMAFEMICTKFVQTFPVVGIAGGLSDLKYVNRITKYADLKYRRRHLLSLMDRVEENEVDGGMA